MLAVFAALSWFAVETKCATFDEPLHAASAYVSTFDSEYRIDPEDPPLWKYWAMLPHHTGELYIEHQGKGWDWAIVQPRNQSVWAGHMLYNTTGVDGTGFIERTRMMFLPLGVIAGAAMAFWSYRLFGRIAAIVTTVLFSFDPTFLAHSPLVKNDVSITLVMLLFMITVYQVGRRLTWMNALALGLLLGVGLTVKYSGVLLGPMMALALLVRVSLPTPWIVIGQELHRRRQRLLAAIGVMIVATIMACIIVWACYRFRFDSGPGGAQLDMTPILQMVADNRFFLHEHRWPEHDESRGWENSATVRVAMLFEKHHLLPQAWIGGFLSTYAAAIVRPAFLMGKIYETGCWYYFPLAMLFKMPVATLLTLAAGVIWGMTRLYSAFSRRACSPSEAASMLAGCTKTSNTWRLACLWIPIVIYGASAMSSNLNLGIRHLLPIMPFVFILLGSCRSDAASASTESVYDLVGCSWFGAGRGDVCCVSRLHPILQPGRRRQPRGPEIARGFQSRLGPGSARGRGMAIQTPGNAAVPDLFRPGASRGLRHQIRSRSVASLHPGRQRDDAAGNLS